MAPGSSAPEPNQASNDYVSAVTRKIFSCPQKKGHPAVLHDDGEMTDGAGRSSSCMTVPGLSPDDLTYRADGEEHTTAAEAAVPPPPS